MGSIDLSEKMVFVKRLETRLRPYAIFLATKEIVWHSLFVEHKAPVSATQ